MIISVIVLGAGSAGLMAALAVKRHFPELRVQVVRDPALGIIGVGESTTPNVPSFLFDFLRIDPGHFYAVANPTWKIGIHFLWGPRPHFQFPFTKQLDVQLNGLTHPNGFYCTDEFSFADSGSALMVHGKAFRRAPNGAPDIRDHAYHIFNPDYVKALEMVGKEWGIEFVDGAMERAERGPQGIAAILLKDGRRLAADFFIDASGFRSELLGRVLEEPFVSFGSSLYCDRAIVGGWNRTNEPILPYTTAETMDAGWCWQIEHEKLVNRGYVYCSSAISDDEARAEFLRKNPKAEAWSHAVKFKSGRYRRGWVENVVAMGNAGGFVEPLEATALMLLCAHCQTLVPMLRESNLSPTPTLRNLYNEFFMQSWDEIRNFLSIHYRFNTRLDTPFWRQCRADVDVSGVQDLLDFYAENGPTRLCRHLVGSRGQEMGVHSAFGIEGYLVILTGNRVPYKNMHSATDEERQRWSAHLASLAEQARSGMTVEEALASIRGDPVY